MSVYFSAFNRVTIVLALLAVCYAPRIQAQPSYDLLVKGGHVIDPKNEINSLMDVAVNDGVIEKVARRIPASEAAQVVDAAGFYVTPGLIDVHAHVFVGMVPRTFAGGFSSVSPDGFTFRSGVTTVVDPGTAGWRNFSAFREQVIDQSATRILAFLNIFGHGLTSGSGIHDHSDIDVEQAYATVKEHPDIIVGVRLGHYLGESREPLDKALETAELAEVPFLLECHLPELPLKDILERMRPGDTVTHVFGDVGDRESILDERNRVRDYVFEAKNRGIIFDVGHGGGSFHFSQAVPAMEQGLLPDTFGTDLHRSSMNGGMKNMLNILSKYLNMGMSVEDIILRATWNAARSVRREDLGHLSPGAVADLAVLSIKQGEYGFVDAGGYRMDGSSRFETELTLRAGRIVWDLNGLTAPLWNQQAKK
ncbi:MAG: amidohydrolase/deacetylase family metallohydrolase [Balneolaceae bacterium]